MLQSRDLERWGGDEDMPFAAPQEASYLADRESCEKYFTYSWKRLLRTLLPTPSKLACTTRAPAHLHFKADQTRYLAERCDTVQVICFPLPAHSCFYSLLLMYCSFFCTCAIDLPQLPSSSHADP